MPERFLEIENLDAVLAKLGPELLQKPVRDMLTDIVDRIENDAKSNAPVGVSGLLRATITHEVDPTDLPLWAKVGSNVEYAPYMEYGTGALGDPEAPYSHQSSHWPPGDALERWAQLHDIASGFAVARAIGLRGGLEPRHFLRDAVNDNEGFIEDAVGKCGQAIGEIWESNV